MKKKLFSCLLVICLLVVSFSSSILTASAASAKGYKVYPFSIFAGYGSTKISMTPDGGYTVGKSPKNTTEDYAWFSFQVALRAKVVDYEAMPYLYLNNINTNAPVTISAQFIDKTAVTGNQNYVEVYTSAETPMKANSTIKINLKEKMGSNWKPSGRILSLSFWVTHSQTDAKLNLSSIWLGANNADFKEDTKVETQAINFFDETDRYVSETSKLEKSGDGFVLGKKTKGMVYALKNTMSVSVKNTPYVYFNVKELNNPSNDFAYLCVNNDINQMIGYEDSPGGMMFIHPSVGEADLWYRMDLRRYLSEAEINSPAGITLGVQLSLYGPTSANDFLRMGGVYYGGETFKLATPGKPTTTTAATTSNSKVANNNSSTETDPTETTVISDTESNDEVSTDKTTLSSHNETDVDTDEGESGFNWLFVIIPLGILLVAAGVFVFLKFKKKTV